MSPEKTKAGSETKPALSASQVDELVRLYVEAVVALAPGSIAGVEVGGRMSGNRLVRLLELRDHNNPLRYCSPEERQALIVQVMGRSCIVDDQANGFGVVVATGRRASRLSTSEAARWLEIREDVLLERLARAREAVRAAVLESRLARSAA